MFSARPLRTGKGWAMRTVVGRRLLDVDVG
jgi:hypothetical protein